jgi:trigger factor
MRSERATLTLAEEGNPGPGDDVQVRLTTHSDEADAAPAEAQEYRFVLGEGQAIPAIEEAIMSLSPGEERDFEISFPDDFADPEQAGKTVRMTIGLVELKHREFPPLDDDFAREAGASDSLEALRARLRADLQEDARRRADAAVRDALVGQILEANPVEAPASMVDRWLDYMTGVGEGQRRRQRTPEQEERFSQFREMMRPQAEAALKRMLVIESLAEREGLRATQDEVDARVEALAQAHGRSPSDVWLELEKSGQLQGLESEITEDKVFDWLRGQNTVG